MPSAVSTRKTWIDPNELPPVGAPTLRRIFGTIRPYRREAATIAVAMFGSALLNLVPPLLVKRVIDVAIPNRDGTALLVLCAGMLAGPLCAGLLGVAQKYFATVMGERVMLDLRVQLYRHLHRQSLGWFSAARPGESVSRVLNDVQGVGSIVSGTMVDIAQSTIVLTTTIALIFWLDWRLALLAIALLPLFIAPTRRVGRRRKALKRKTQVRMAELTGILTETLSVSGALLLKVLGAERLETERFERKAREVMDLSLQQSLVGRWFRMLLGLFEAAGPAAVFALGGWLVIRGDVALGTVVAFVTLLKRLYSPASDLAGVHVDFVTSYACFDRIFQVLDMEPAIADSPGAFAAHDVRGALSLRGVSFSFGGAPTLASIDLEIPAGACVALVGPSGAGKSTLAALVPRLHDPTGGAILLDGQDLRNITLDSLRAQIGVVTQETVLFHASILENLRQARPGASLDDVTAASRAAQIHDVIAALPEGYDTLVGDRGYRFSGGERQRLAIARAILRDPRILILDEATSALDAQNEALVQQALVPLMRGRTSLVIAHRLSTIRNADLIVVLEAGRVVERGTHEELLSKAGLYAHLHARQLGAS